MSEPDAREGDALLSASQVARQFGVRLNTVAKWRRKGWLRAVTTPDGKRYRESDITAASIQIGLTPRMGPYGVADD